MNLYEAIFVRKTVRKFKTSLLEQSVMDCVLNFADSLIMLFPDITVDYKVLNYSEAKQFFSRTPSIKSPHYLVLFSEKASNYLINAGYLMQQISLYLTAKGFGSCYMGTMRPKKSSLVGMDKDYVITLAFGEGEHEIYRSSDKAKRLPMEDIAVFKSEVNRNIKTIIQAGRLAPSGMNSQPWGFVVYDNRIHIFCKKNIFLSSVLSEMKLIDIGICLAHLLVAAEELWVDTKMVRLDNISNITFKKNDYFLTLKMS